MSVSFVEVASLQYGDTGSEITVTQIVFVAIRHVGTGPGGDQSSPRTVANTIQAVSFHDHHKFWEIIIAFDIEMYTNLYVTGVNAAGTVSAVEEAAANALIEKFIVSITDSAGVASVWTWTISTTKVADVKIRVDNDNQTPTSRQPTEVKFVSIGARVVT